MSGHWRFSVAAFLLCASYPAAPAFSNALTDLFDSAPKEAAAPAPAQEQCALQPGKSTAPGQHWVYRHEGHRRCWFPVDQAAVSVKKQKHQHGLKRHVRAPEKNEAALAKKTVLETREKTVLDARAQLLSAAPDTFQSAAPATEVVDTASALPDSTAVTAAPVATHPTTDQLRPEPASRGPADVDMVLAAEPPANDAVAADVPPVASGAPSIAVADESDGELMPTRAGVVLIALGFILLLGSLLASRFLGPRVASIPPA